MSFASPPTTRPVKIFSCPICSSQYSDRDFPEPAAAYDLFVCLECSECFELNSDGTTSLVLPDFEDGEPEGGDEEIVEDS
ncbi:MAG TPA: hypothetical protein VGQ87_01855 [Patescibacteria group bacterium]|nr:hypothetical protein [Patescibacteria group bacterium]